MPTGAHQLFDPEAPPLPASEEPAPEAESDGRRGVLSIGSLYEEVQGALQAAFPRNRQLWVRGEIQHISDHRSGHLYMDLVDPGEDGARPRPAARGGVPTLNVKCWRSSWAPLRRGLAKEGIELAEGMVVVLRGTLDVYRAKGEISFILAEVDVTALLGRMAAQRAQLLRKLEAEGLLGRNAGLRVPEVTMHVGLIASPGTEGYQDFVGQLTGSGFGFRVSFVPVSVQGPGAPAAIAHALKMLSRSDCDVIAMVRGGSAGRPGHVRDRGRGAGGGRRDEAGFHRHRPQRRPERGRHRRGTHLHHSHRVRAPDRHGDPTLVGGPRGGARGAVGARVPGFLGDAQARDGRARGRLARRRRNQVRVHRDRLARKASTVARSAPGCLESARQACGRRPPDWGRWASGISGARTSGCTRGAGCWPPRRRPPARPRLQPDPHRRRRPPSQHAGAVVEQQEIVTRFADGTVRSRVEGANVKREPAPQPAPEQED